MKTLHKRLLGGLLFFILLGVSFWLFSIRISYLTERGVDHQLVTMADNNADSIRSMFSRDVAYLKGIAEELSNQNAVLGAEAAKQLHLPVHNTAYAEIAIDLPDGSSYSGDGKSTMLSDRSDLDEVLRGRTVFTDYFSDSEDCTASISISVPIREDGKVGGALRCVYQENILAESLDPSSFEGEGYFHLISANGDFLFKQPKVKLAYGGNNLFQALETAAFQKGASLSELRENIGAGKKGSVVYTLAGEERYVYYQPIGIDDWYIMSVVPMRYLLQQKQAIDGAAAVLLLFLTLIFVAMTTHFVLLERKMRQSAERDRDYLNGIINSIPLPVFIASAEKQVEFINEAALTLFQKERKELIGAPCHNCDTAICGTPDCSIDRMRRTGEKQTLFEMADHHYIVSTALLEQDCFGSGGFVEVIQDVSEIVEMQKILEEKTLELETISENLMGGVLITTLGKGFPIIRCNRGYCDLFGHDEAYFLGKCALNGVVFEDRDEIEEEIYRQLKTGAVSLEHRLYNGQSDEERWVSLYGKQAGLHGTQVAVWMMLDISERKKAERELEINEERYRIATQNTEDIIVDYNIKTRVMLHTSKATELYGVAEAMENAPESLIESGVIDPRSKDDFLKLFDQIRAGTPKESCILLAHALCGKELWNRLTFTAIFDRNNSPVRAIGILQDITDEMEAKQQYKREAQYRGVIGRDAALYYEVDLTRSRFITGHESLFTNCGCARTDEFDQVFELLLEHMIYPPDRESVWKKMSREALLKSFRAGTRKIVFEYRRKDSDGNPTWVESTLYLLEDELTKNIEGICYIKDINELKLREFALRQKAERDLLTGLYNKVTAENDIRRQLLLHTDGHGNAALLLIDLDNFKQINDTLGHAFGDAVLSEVSRKLAALFGDANVVGRMGGDEFGVFLPASDGAYAEQQARLVCEMFHGVYTGSDHSYRVSGSVGIALFPYHGSTFEELYRRADIALYCSKKKGKDAYMTYREEMSDIQTDAAERTIDRNAGKIFSENMVEYVVQILYESADPESVAGAVLELVAKYFHYSRAYLFEHVGVDDLWRGVYEWHSDSVCALCAEHQIVSAGTMESCSARFSREGVFIAPTADAVSEPLRTAMRRNATCSSVQFAMMQQGKLTAMVGFDDCIRERTPTETETGTLHMVSMLLATYLRKKTNRGDNLCE